jgi:hypothetical protein
MVTGRPSLPGIITAGLFLAACVWLVFLGHSWEGVILAVVFMIVGAIRSKG